MTDISTIRYTTRLGLYCKKKGHNSSGTQRKVLCIPAGTQRVNVVGAAHATYREEVSLTWHDQSSIEKSSRVVSLNE